MCSAALKLSSSHPKVTSTTPQATPHSFQVLTIIKHFSKVYSLFNNYFYNPIYKRLCSHIPIYITTQTKQFI